MIELEGELEFDFGNAHRLEHLDRKGRALPDGMSLVDFVIEEREHIIFLEIKDPSNARAPESQRQSFIRYLQNGELVNNRLVPKARDSYTFLHLMERENKPIIYVFLFGSESLSVTKASLSILTDRLFARILKETDEPWKRRYIKDCIVVNIEDWQTYFPQYPVRRVSQI